MAQAGCAVFFCRDLRKIPTSFNMNHSAFLRTGQIAAPVDSIYLERKSDQRMLGYLFDNKKKRDNLERYDDKRRQDNRGNGGGNGDEGDNHGNSGKGPNRQNLMIMLLATVIALVVISYVMNMGSESATRIRTTRSRKSMSARTAWRSSSRTPTRSVTRALPRRTRR